MDKKEQLLQAIKEHPERELFFMYSSEGNSDYAYTVGKILEVEVTETTTYNEERVYFADEYDSLLETIEEDIYFEKYRDNMSKVLTDEENAEIEHLAKEEIEKYEWTPVIAVYVG